jgi:hypothetical protein
MATATYDSEMADPTKATTVYDFIPNLGRLRDDVLFGDVWEGDDLSERAP